MKQHRCKFRTDTEAVSEVIGMILLLAILVMFFTLLQVSMVPYWNKQVEAAEMKVTYDDMMFLPSDIEDVAIHETPKTFTVQLGAQYPDRMIFRNPGPGAFGTLAVKEAPVPIIVTYNDDNESTVSYNSKRITYEMSGMINSPKLVYEHGVIITDWGTVNLTTDEQKLIANDNIYIPILNGSSSSKSAIRVESLAIKPYEYLDTLGDINNVSVTLDTDYPEVWEDTLLSSSVVENLSFIGTVEFGGNNIYINTSVVPYLKLPNQTASGPLHAGMISCTVENPDGGGNGGGNGGGGGGNGTGKHEVASGSLWWNIPSSDNITKLKITAIAYDPSISLKNDAIRIIVKDDDGDWWKVVVAFAAGAAAIDKLIATSKAAGTTQSIYDFDPDLDVDSSSTYPIDLLDTPYDPTDARYQDANINDTNTLITYLDSGSSGKQTALIFYELDIDD